MNNEKMKHCPPALNAGDKIGIFLPSSPVKEPYRGNGLKALTELGYGPVEVDNVLSKEPAADFLAKPPEESFLHLQRFFNDPEIKALWAGRGGYGANLLLPLLQRLEVPRVKMVIGSSDVSYLLWCLLDRFNMVVFYGPMVYSSLAGSRFNKDHLKKILTGNFQGSRIPGETLVAGKIKGIVTGGCLSNFVSLLGTPYLPEVEGRILLLEDVGERPYRLDRMFWQLAHAGVFGKIKGLLLGQFPRCFKDNREKESLLKRVQYYLNDFNIPVIYDLPVGHGDNIHTLPLGIEVKIDTAGFDGILLT
ncbi:MAG: LD-carboxypeptidase [bacterium]|nr:LD-carboxypeptidase [bacterium]